MGKMVLSSRVDEFDGFVQGVRDGVAHLDLKAADGEKLWAEHPFAELEAAGIREGRRFKLRTVVSLEFEAVPDVEMTEEREREIDEEIKRAFGDSL